METNKAHLIILPGSMCDRWAYAHQIETLSATRDILVPHLLGADSLDTMAETILQQAPPRFALAGHAMGGRVALEIMRRAPQRVEALALIATTVHPVREGEGPRRQRQIDLAQASGMAALAAAWLPRIVYTGSLADAALMEGLTQMYGRFTPADYAREVHALLHRPDPRTILRQIACPTLVVSGREDALCTPDQSRSLAAEIPQATLQILEDCAHFPTVEQPAAVTDCLLRLLS